MNNLEIIEEVSDGNFYLRKISSIDEQFVYESLKEQNLTRYLSLGPSISREYTKMLIKNYLKYWKDKDQFNYIIELHESTKKSKKKKQVGSISIWGISWQHRRAEIGIWVNSKYWNQGIAKKAIELIKIVCFNHLGLNRLEAHIASENKKSIQLFKDCGFSLEGQLKQYLNLRGVFYDAVLLSFLKEHWKVKS
jgi:RimJ/RimL family protein N-acetyltransferase